MKRFQIIATTCLLSVLFLTGCGSQNTIDGSSAEAAKKSIERISTKLTEQEKKEFQKALITLAMYDEDGNMLMAKALFDQKTRQEVMSQSPEEFAESHFKSLDGKTPSEVIEKAKKIQEKAGKKIDKINEMIERQSSR